MEALEEFAQGENILKLMGKVWLEIKIKNEISPQYEEIHLWAKIPWHAKDPEALYETFESLRLFETHGSPKQTKKPMMLLLILKVL